MPFWKKKKALPSLEFNSGRDFFDYQCDFGVTDIIQGQGLVALVLDAREEFGTESAVATKEDGVQTVALKVVSSDGGFTVLSETFSGSGPRLNPDDVVIWVPYERMPEMAAFSGDERTAWMGLIRAKLTPELDPNKSSFTVESEF